MKARRLEVGPGFVRARECPDCLHTRCGEDCLCNCDAAHAEHDLAKARAKIEELEKVVAQLQLDLNRGSP